MKTESKWELMVDSQPSEQFVCTYGGPFAQRMLLDRGQIEKFLSIAALDGRVLLQESKVRRPQAIPKGINPDGSVTGRGSLRWGQKIYDNGGGKTQNPYFQVEPDDAGWVISVNGGLIMDGLMEKGNLTARDVEKETVKKINYYSRVGLREVVLKEKLTPIKDPYLPGRIYWTGLTFAIDLACYNIFEKTDKSIYVFVGTPFICFGLVNIFFRHSLQELGEIWRNSDFENFFNMIAVYRKNIEKILKFQLRV